MSQAGLPVVHQKGSDHFRGDHPRAMHVTVSRSGTALVLTQASGVGDASERYDDAFVAAVRVYERRSWLQAYSQFAMLGDQGNAPAAKLALLMLRYGHALYGETFTAPPSQIARWAQCVLRATARSSVQS